MNTRSSVLSILACLLIGSVLFALVAPYAGMAGMLALLGLFVIGGLTASFVIAIVAETWASTRRARVGIFLIILPVMVGFFLLEIRILGLVRKNLVTRPMFHNHYVWHERTVLPFWYPSWPVADEFGQWVHADYHDNLLVVVLVGLTDDSSPRFWGSEDEFHVQISDATEAARIRHPRTPDELVVIRSDGNYESYRLGAGLAEQFHRAHRRERSGNILRHAGQLLGAEQRREFDHFVSAYKEPVPPRPMFCNEHTTDTPPLAPYWHQCVPIRDASDNWLWSDYDDNVLVVVVGVPDCRLYSWRRRHADNAAFRLEDDKSSHLVDVIRTKNSLFVIRQDGSLVDFDLREGMAERFYQAHVSNVKEADLLCEVATLLGEEQRREFEKFVARP